MARIDFYSESIRGKIIAIAIIAALSIALSWIILRIAFRKVVDTIEEVSKPNDKLVLLNSLSNDIAQIGQYQRKQILQNPTKSNPIDLPETEKLIDKLDTLRKLCTGNKIQLNQIDSIEQVMTQYDVLVVNYLKLYEGLFSNKPLTGKFKTLSNLIFANALKMDSNVITSVKNGITTTTFVASQQMPTIRQRSSFLKRFFQLFGNEIPKADNIPLRQIIQKEQSVHTDTLVVSQRDSLKRAIDVSVQNIDKYQRSRSITLANGELNLIRDANGFINRIRGLLREMEEVEIVRLKSNDAILIQNVKSSMTRIIIIMVLFIIIMSVLVYLVFTDIKLSKLYRKQLLEAKEEAEYLSTVKQRFVSNMSHEIRTPLQTIIGFSEQILQQDIPSKSSIEAIHYSSEHLLQIVNEVLDYSRIVSGKFKFEKRSFNMDNLLREVTVTMNLQAIKKNIHLEYNAKESYPVLYLGDAFRLKQILYNLIGNAIKFTNAGGNIKLDVESTVKDTCTQFSFHITDSGIGISKDDLKRIFNEFEQADSMSQNPTGGTGLGLNIVKRLVEEQGGTLTAESKLLKGSVFSITLTFENAEKVKKEEHKETHSTKIDFTGKVLIIDDDPFILKLCSNIFDKYAIKHTCQLSSEDLIKQEWDNDITLIFTDIRMPGINGIELCKFLRNRIRKGVKIIALTANALQNEQSDILEQGFDGLITKPFKEADLISCLNNNSEKLKKPDLSVLLSMCMGDQELLQKSLQSFISETTQDMVTLRQFLDQQDKNGLMEMFHKLAGRIGQIGDMQLSYKLRKSEMKLKLPFDFSKEATELNVVIEEISRLINAVMLEIVIPDINQEKIS
jgi:signal transduction histidine kinase/DNA-binding NarL/FixJ family response regulator